MLFFSFSDLGEVWDAQTERRPAHMKDCVCVFCSAHGSHLVEFSSRKCSTTFDPLQPGWWSDPHLASRPRQHGIFRFCPRSSATEGWKLGDPLPVPPPFSAGRIATGQVPTMGCIRSRSDSFLLQFITSPRCSFPPLSILYLPLLCCLSLFFRDLFPLLFIALAPPPPPPTRGSLKLLCR